MINQGEHIIMYNHLSSQFFQFVTLSNAVVQFEEVQCSIECHDQFYCENNFCNPRCDKFEEYSHSYTVATDVLAIVAACIGIVAGLAVLVIFCLRYQKMYVHILALLCKE